MIVSKIRALYEAEDKPQRGNPTGSRFGKCVAQMQLLRFPEIGQPEPFPVRSKITMEEGDRVEEWWGQQIERAFPNLSGLQQEPFYFRVPLLPDQIESVRRQIALPYGTDGRLWGTLVPGFSPPRIDYVEATDRIKLKLLPRGKDGGPAKLGFVLDPGAGCVWAPTYVDRILKHEDLGGRPAVLEKKAMSNWAFRRVLLNHLDYERRAQLAGLVEATGLDLVLLAYRKETAHLAEVVYTRAAERARVVIAKLNGQEETYWADPSGAETVLDATGKSVSLPGDHEWEVAQVWTPFEPALLEQIRERVRRVLLWDGNLATLHREAGPSFTCETCDGTGTQTMAKRGGAPLKKAKPCEDCAGGHLDRARLPSWPCGYCATRAVCYPMAKLELTDKPTYWIKRAEWESSGLSFMPPE